MVFRLIYMTLGILPDFQLKKYILNNHYPSQSEISFTASKAIMKTEYIL